MSQLFDVISTNQTIGAVIVAVIGCGLGLWLAAAWWAYADVARRVQPEVVRLLAPAWILASTPILLPLSLAAYLLIRPQETIAERRSHRLLGALVPSLGADGACPACGRRIEDDWRRCPSCSTWLAAPCARCGQWSAIEAQVCPFCAADWLAVEAASGDVAALAPVDARPATDRGLRPEATRAGAERRGNRKARGDRRARRAAPAPGPRLARIGR